MRLTTVNKRVLDVPSSDGRPVVLILAGQGDQEWCGALHARVRAEFPSPDAVLVAQVAHLKGVPFFVKPIVSWLMRRKVKQASRAIPAGAGAHDLVIVVADWTGAVAREMGVRDIPAASVVVPGGEPLVCLAREGDEGVDRLVGRIAAVSRPADSESGGVS